MVIKEITSTEFDKATKSFPCKNFFQTSMMGNVLEKRGRKVYYIGLYDNNKIVGLSMLSESYSFLGKKSFDCLKGFLIDYSKEELISEFTKLLVSFVKQKGGYKLTIDPYIVNVERDIDGNIVSNGVNNTSVVNTIKKCGYKKSPHDTQVKTNFCLDLEGKTEEEIFSDFKQNTRNLISRAERFGVEIEDAKYSDLPRFKAITENTSKKRGFPDKSLEYYQYMYNEFKDLVTYKIAKLNVNKYIDYLNKTAEDYKDKISKIAGENKKKDNYIFELENINKKLDKINNIAKGKEYIDLAASMFILYGDETIYLFSGSYDEYAEFAGPYLIQWNIIKYAIENKYKRHNFFGILNYTDEKDPEYGIYLFKRGFNGYVEEQIGEYYYPIGLVGKLYKIKQSIKK